MPVLNRKYDNVKVYRPNGTKFAEGEAKYFLRASGNNHTETRFVLDQAFHAAAEAFYVEFGRMIRRDQVVVEATYDSFGCKVTIYEIPAEEGA